MYISYNGSHFVGFQEQVDKNTIMKRLTCACKELGITSKLVGSGRTDTNVHALNQVVHVDLPQFWQDDTSKLQKSLNILLFPYIYVKKIIKVKESLHARFDAKKRLYRYIFYHEEQSPFLNDFALFSKNLNIDKLNIALSCFLGEHDFGYFKKTRSPTSTDTRIIYKAKAYKFKNFTIINILGNGFLRAQVRMMLSAAIEVQDDVLTLKKLKEQIEKKTRHTTKLLPGYGLYLSRVFYDFY